MEPDNMGTINREAVDAIDNSPHAAEEDSEESSIADNREFIETNQDVFSTSSDTSAPRSVANGALSVEGAQQGFHSTASPPLLEGVNAGEPPAGGSDLPRSADPPVLPTDAPPPGAAPPPPLATEASLEEIRTMLEEMQNDATAITAEDAAAALAAREAETIYKNSSLWHAKCTTYMGGFALTFAVVAYLVDKFSSKSAGPVQRTEGQDAAGLAMPAAGASSGIQAWHAQLDSVPRQAIDNLYNAWSSMDELEVFNRMSGFSRRFASQLAVYEHIELLQLVKQVGSARNQQFIWYESEKLTYVTHLANLLNTYGYPTFYRNLACAGVNGRALPVTVAAYAGQMAIAYVFNSRKPTEG